ncbi:hypothetical protein J2Y67_001892 [Neobacillus niacini]|nr:hypothetical protein [Neobacillus niacini]
MLEEKIVELKFLYLEDAIYIFAINSLQVLFWFLLSPFGLSLPFIFKFIYSMGQAPHNTEIDGFWYYLSSIAHGVGEIIVSFIVFMFTIKQFYFFYLFLKTKQANDLKRLYIELLKKYIPISIIILFISAIFEVYISNRIILNIQSFGLMDWMGAIL